MASGLLQPEERVLSTLESDGSRRWLTPKLSRGRFLTARRWVAYALILIFTAIPHVHLNGKPLILLDILHRRFTFFGYTFHPTDTALLALFMVGLIVSIFFVTALFGRVWCGWACPQTVYMEFIYRPIERLFHGNAGRGGKPAKTIAPWRRVAKYVVFFIISAVLANTFIAYFAGADNVLRWMTGSPFDHPVAFMVMAVVTGLMMFDFCFFREQLCIIACPYGRLQSVMLDPHSLIISYDPKRGEPRGKLSLKQLGPADPPRGDCIDCHLCVTTCPTGIDIRDGLQLECVACAQCIDACDAVMEKIGKPIGLIRYSTQHVIAGHARKLLRPRVVIYPAIVLAITALFTAVLLSQGDADVRLLRSLGAPFIQQDDGRVMNPMRLKITNRTDAPRTYTADAADGVALTSDQLPVEIPPGQSATVGIQLTAPAGGFVNGRRQAALTVNDDAGFSQTVETLMLGPTGAAGAPSRNDP